MGEADEGESVVRGMRGEQGWGEEGEYGEVEGESVVKGCGRERGEVLKEGVWWGDETESVVRAWGSERGLGEGMDWLEGIF